MERPEGALGSAVMKQNGTGRRSAASEQSSMGLYLRDLRRIPLLGAEEEQRCARSAAQGDATARQRLIQANLRFVIAVARRYRNCGLPLEDLVNEGNIGLIRAVEKYDPDRGFRFVSYAVWWIRHAILKAIRENGGLVRMPDGQPAQWTVSLDSPVGDSGDSESFGALLEDRRTARPEETMVGTSLKEEIGSIMSVLSDRETEVLKDRYGLAGRTLATLQEAGSKYRLSRERIRQIERKALSKIRAAESASELEAYVS